MREQTEQVQTNKQLSDEELQRTQVLNLADFKETARIEKITSKKPAIVIAILGFLSISLGTIFPAVQSLQARKEAEQDSTVSARKEPVLKNKSEKVTCTKDPGMYNGTNRLFEIKYTFENDQLVSAEKSLTIAPVNATGEATVTWYIGATESLLKDMSGYNSKNVKKDKGVVSVINIDYELLDITTIPKANQENAYFKSDFHGKEKKADVIAKNEANGFQCSGDIAITNK